MDVRSPEIVVIILICNQRHKTLACRTSIRELGVKQLLFPDKVSRWNPNLRGHCVGRLRLTSPLDQFKPNCALYMTAA